MAGLNERQRKFVLEYLKSGIATDAAIKAGYSEKNAAPQASKLLANPEVQAYRREMEQKLFDEMGISQAWIGRRLVEVVERCMEATPHMTWNSVTRRKEPDGSWVFDSQNAVKALHELYIQMGFAQEEDDGPKDKGLTFEDWLAKQNETSRL